MKDEFEDPANSGGTWEPLPAAEQERFLEGLIDYEVTFEGLRVQGDIEDLRRVDPVQREALLLSRLKKLQKAYTHAATDNQREAFEGAFFLYRKEWRRISTAYAVGAADVEIAEGIPEPGSGERAPEKRIYKMKSITAQEIFKFLESLGYAEKKQDRLGREQFYIMGKDFSAKGRILGFVLSEAFEFIGSHPEKSIPYDTKTKITDSFYAIKKPGNVLPDTLTDAATRSRDKIMRLDSTLREKLHDAVLASLS